MSRSIKMGLGIDRRGACAAILAATSGLFSASAGASAVDFATIVPGSLTQGSVRSSLVGGSYANVNANLGDWPLNTGGTASDTFAISYENPDFNGNSFGGNANTMIAFGVGGGVTLKLNTPITPHAGEKDLGIFTAQAMTGGNFTLNGNMDAAILVSADGVNWFGLDGTRVASPTTYTAITHPLDAPTMAYDFETGANAWNYGAGTSLANLNALAIANFTEPMPNDNLFDGTGTAAQRNALITDTSTADYAAIFGDSGGGNWFDISGSGLTSVDYIRLNGDVNDPTNGGVRLDAVFANAAAVPEPACLGILVSGFALLRRRR
jgi:hypothetical protein